MNIFSRGSKKRQEFVAQKITETNSNTQTNYTEKEAQDAYMKTKEEWAAPIITALKDYCAVLRDPKKIWNTNKKSYDGTDVFWKIQNEPIRAINEIMNSQVYKNVEQGGSSSTYLDQLQNGIAPLTAKNYNSCTDSANFKSSMKSCGNSLSKLKHPIRSTALVKVGDKGNRIVDYVDELARLLVNKTVQENAAILVKLLENKEWPENDAEYTYKSVDTKYVKLGE